MVNKNPLPLVLLILAILISLLWLAKPYLKAVLHIPVDQRAAVATTKRTPTLTNTLKEVDPTGTFLNNLNAEIKDQLDNSPYTVFLPKDLNVAAENYIIAGHYSTAELHHGQKLLSLGGAILAVTVHDGKIWINEESITTPDIETETGVIHILEK